MMQVPLILVILAVTLTLWMMALTLRLMVREVRAIMTCLLGRMQAKAKTSQKEEEKPSWRWFD